MFQSLIKEGEIGLKQDFLIYGTQYKLKRNGEYLGIGTFTDDPNIGDSFLQAIVNDEGEEGFHVIVADEWEFA